MQAPLFKKEEIVKNPYLAAMYREKGNSLFKEKNFFEALQSYNKSMLTAAKGSREASLAIANRSAVYMEVKEFQLCLDNIQLARDSAYPAEMIQTLNDREARCKKLMENYEADPNDDPWNFFKLSYPASETIPFIVNCLELRENKKFGRHIVTNRDLKAGDIIAIETPFAKTIDSMSRHMLCTHCLKPNKMSLIPCDYSSQTMFCSLKCKEEGWRIYLDSEFRCKVNDITQRTFREALDICEDDFDKLQQLIDDPELSKKTIFDFDFSNEDDPLYKYHQLLAFNSLFQGRHTQKVDEIQNHPCLKLLRSKKEKETAKAFMLRVFKIYMAITFGIDWQSSTRSAIRTLAWVVLLFGGLLNVSCVPNVDRLHVDNKYVFFVRQRIKKGEQLFLAHGLRFFDFDCTTRAGFLHQQYGLDVFNCSCEACVHRVKPQQVSYEFPFHEDLIRSGSKAGELIERFKINCAKINAENKSLPSLNINKLMDENIILLFAIAKNEPYIFQSM